MTKRLICFIGFMCLICLFQSPAQAVDLGSGISLDGNAMIGKPFDVQTDHFGDVSTIKLTTRESSLFASGEVGVRYNIVRVFGRYETSLHDYDLKTVGVDVNVWNPANVGAVGIRAAYNYSRKFGLGSQRMLVIGPTFRF